MDNQRVFWNRHFNMMIFSYNQRCFLSGYFLQLSKFDTSEQFHKSQKLMYKQPNFLRYL